MPNDGWSVLTWAPKVYNVTFEQNQEARRKGAVSLVVSIPYPRTAKDCG